MGIEELDRMHPRVREKYLEILRSIPIGRRLEITSEFCDSIRELVADGIRHQHPDWTEADVRREILRRALPEDLRKRVYGW